MAILHIDKDKILTSVGERAASADRMTPEQKTYLQQLIQQTGGASLAPKLPKQRKLSAESTVLSPVSSDISGFTEIGYGKPLTIRIAHAYTGKFPREGLFGSSEDMILVSGLKDETMTEGVPRALNFLIPKVKKASHIVSAQAFKQGSALVAHYPALMSSAFTLQFQMIFDGFDRELVDKFAVGVEAAAGLPILAPGSGYLLGAGQLLRLGGRLADSLYDGAPEFDRSEPLAFSTPGFPAQKAGFHIVANQGFDASALSFVPVKGLVGPNGKAYDGPEPYIVISLDGSTNEKLASFAPLQATADLLGRFLSLEDGRHVAIDALVGSLRYANDIKYWRQANDLLARLQGMSDKQSKEYVELLARFKAARDNISAENAALKPKDPA